MTKSDAISSDRAQRPHVPRKSFLGLVAQLAVFLSLVLVTGLGIFARATDAIPATTQSADAIVALTGGASRIDAAFAALQQKSAPILLISGVHPNVSVDRIKSSWKGDQTIFECCVVLGREATSTVGNAKEIAKFVAERQIKSLIVVTADYHLPRALIQIHRLSPDVRLIAMPVRAEHARSRDWWRDPTALRRVGLEYCKYIYVAAEEFWARRPIWHRDIPQARRNAPDDPSG